MESWNISLTTLEDLGGSLKNMSSSIQKAEDETLEAINIVTPWCEPMSALQTTTTENESAILSRGGIT